MSRNCTQGRPDSLAAYLARLRPGDSCACCGAALESVNRPPRSSRCVSVGSVPRSGDTIIVCPECGCEISEETGNDADDTRRELSPAA